MNSSITKVKSSYDNILQTIKEGNYKIEELINLISAIEEKTDVINDIVFQTKLPFGYIFYRV